MASTVNHGTGSNLAARSEDGRSRLRGSCLSWNNSRLAGGCECGGVRVRMGVRVGVSGLVSWSESGLGAGL